MSEDNLLDADHLSLPELLGRRSYRGVNDSVERDAARSLLQRSFKPMGEGSQRGAMLGLMCTGFGSGVLALSWVMSLGGFAVGVVLLTIAAFGSLQALRALANLGLATGLDSYSAVVKDILGDGGSQALEWIIFVHCWGSCVGYIVFLGQIGPSVFASLGTPFLRDRTPIVWISGFIVLFPFLLRTVGALRYLSTLSLFSLVYVMIIIVVQSFTKLSDVDQPFFGTGEPGWFNGKLGSKDQRITDLFLGFSICVYSFSCHVNLFSSYTGMTNPEPRRVGKVLDRATVGSWCVYMMVAICGYMSFGNDTKDDVLVNYRADIDKGTGFRFFDIVANFAMCFSLMVAYTLNGHAGRAEAERLLDRFRRTFCGADLPESPAGSRSDLSLTTYRPRVMEPSIWSHIGVTVAFHLSVLVVAWCEQDIKSILGVLGGFCATTFQFLIPVILLRKLVRIQPFDEGSHVGAKYWVTPAGVRMLTIIFSFYIVAGYTAAGISCYNLVAGRH
mmetsp:Transcript_36318/g.95279  ORF Transcript_36318/g.95279 Transcript_36318/m.95279 type:complete len:501 (-) Transcript_36318:85-1587(-)